VTTVKSRQSFPRKDRLLGTKNRTGSLIPLPFHGWGSLRQPVYLRDVADFVEFVILQVHLFAIAAAQKYKTPLSRRERNGVLHNEGSDVRGRYWGELKRTKIRGCLRVLIPSLNCQDFEVIF
jgi:hypothetical protein